MSTLYCAIGIRFPLLNLCRACRGITSLRSSTSELSAPSHYHSSFPLSMEFCHVHLLLGNLVVCGLSSGNLLLELFNLSARRLQFISWIALTMTSISPNVRPLVSNSRKYPQ